jgi:hypothetical protein
MTDKPKRQEPRKPIIPRGWKVSKETLERVKRKEAEEDKKKRLPFPVIWPQSDD